MRKTETQRFEPRAKDEEKMLKIGNKIRLNAEERSFLRVCLDEDCDPRTMEELVIWIDHAKSSMDMTIPECRLLAALLDTIEQNKFACMQTSL